MCLSWSGQDSEYTNPHGVSFVLELKSGEQTSGWALTCWDPSSAGGVPRLLTVLNVHWVEPESSCDHWQAAAESFSHAGGVSWGSQGVENPWQGSSCHQSWSDRTTCAPVSCWESAVHKLVSMISRFPLQIALFSAETWLTIIAPVRWPKEWMPWAESGNKAAQTFCCLAYCTADSDCRSDIRPHCTRGSEVKSPVTRSHTVGQCLRSPSQKSQKFPVTKSDQKWEKTGEEWDSPRTCWETMEKTQMKLALELTVWNIRIPLFHGVLRDEGRLRVTRWIGAANWGWWIVDAMKG